MSGDWFGMKRVPPASGRTWPPVVTPLTVTSGGNSKPGKVEFSARESAAICAAKLLAVWSTIRLLMMRGCASTTELGGRPATGASGPAYGPCRFTGTSLGMMLSAAPRRSMPGSRLFQVPSTVRNPFGSTALPTSVGR
jgi:hypothetical protein